ncbi:hypothetical protein MtrunA17_Chr1g0157761 [Medicago truncatula]|uniref:Uncharacterized protein n=1 Tax=Medicago truncatula TaxID=3880 RepID=A0A396JHK8_MEDTR|nr:hypothetical protein MtrunA17_Chr1g0157761 [Medicago truncatula]
MQVKMHILLEFTCGAIPNSINKGPMTNPLPTPRSPPKIPASKEQESDRARRCKGQCVP